MAFKSNIITSAEGGTGSSNTATAGKILIGDGTNFVSSTPTFPNTAGTAGNFLQSDGTNFVSQSGSGVALVANTTLTSAQIKALHGTPIQVIAAPGLGKIIFVNSMIWSYDYGGTNVFTAAASQTIKLYYGTTTSIQQVASNANLTGTVSTLGNAGLFSLSDTTNANLAVNLYNSVATEITGNAANDNVMKVQVIYSIYTI